MPLRGEYEPSPEAWVRDQVAEYERSGGRTGTTLQGVPVVVMTTRGRRSGKLRKVPLMRVEHEGRYAAVASNSGGPKHPTWYANLQAEPLVEVQDGTVTGDYRAREVTGDERAQWWDRAVAVWPDYVEYTRRTDREIPVLLLEPVAPNG